MADAAPNLEPRDLEILDATLRIAEAVILCRAHLPRTDRQVEELRKSIEHERRAIEEQAAQARVRQDRADAEQAWRDRKLTEGLVLPKVIRR
jgi:hypothetical protein